MVRPHAVPGLGRGGGAFVRSVKLLVVAGGGIIGGGATVRMGQLYVVVGGSLSLGVVVSKRYIQNGVGRKECQL